MTWLPKDVPASSTISGIGHATDFWFAFNNYQNRRKIESDDLTFMIPFSADCEERLMNLFYCLPWIVFNTTAKIHLAIHEQDSNFEQDGWQIFRTGKVRGSEDVIPFIKSNPGKLASVDASYEFMERFTSNFLLNRFQGAKPDDQARYFEAIGKPMAAAQGHGDSAVIVPDFSAITRDFVSRTTITYERREEDSPFHRTRYLNEMLDKVDTKYVVNHDADVIVPVKSMSRALHILRFWDNTPFVYPYEHYEKGNYQIRVGSHEKIRDRIANACFTGDLTDVCLSGEIMRWSAAYGQSIFCETAFYKAVGGENEEFISWGAEDVERYTRFVKSNAGVARCEGGYVFHLEHPRGADSSWKNPNFMNNEHLWTKLQAMDGPELIEYYKNCQYIKKYGWKLGEIE